MDKLSTANERLKNAHDNHKHEYDAEIAKLNEKKCSLVKRLKELDDKKLRLRVAQSNAMEDAADGDLVEINAGGKIIAAKRSTLTQLKGTRLEGLFSGRWDGKLQRDSMGRIFLDVNPDCFQSIMDYLNERTISSEDDPPTPPTSDDEHKHILNHQLELFGLLGEEALLPVKATDGISKILTNEADVTQLRQWLEDESSNCKLNLLYRSTMDGRKDATFHSKCNGKGCTLTVIETINGDIIGGYANTPWRDCGSNNYEASDKAFLFVLSGNRKSFRSMACQLKLKAANDITAVCHNRKMGPMFGKGHDLRVQGSYVYSSLGTTYEKSPSWPIPQGSSVAIKEMEVYQVIPGWQSPSTSPQLPQKNLPLKARQVECFSKEINDAINAKWVSLSEAEADLLHLEDRFKDEEKFVTFFASGSPQDVVVLNVCGTAMATRRQTLQLCNESALASKFSGEDWASDYLGKTVKNWNHEDVVAWLNRLEGIPESVVQEFEDNQVTGRELLALGAEGLKDFGVTRKGTVYLLLEEIKKLEKAGRASATLIEHSPYCFGKILDHLRLEASFVKGLVKTKHGPPIVRSNEQGRYNKILRHLFPGESSKVFRGDHVHVEDGKEGGGIYSGTVDPNETDYWNCRDID